MGMHMTLENRSTGLLPKVNLTKISMEMTNSQFNKNIKEMNDQ